MKIRCFDLLNFIIKPLWAFTPDSLTHIFIFFIITKLKKMTTKILSVLIIIASFISINTAYAQADTDKNNEAFGYSNDAILVFQGMQKITSIGVKYSFAYAKGDRVILKYITEKDKKLKKIWFADSEGKIIWSQVGIASLTKEFIIPTEGVYTFGLFAKEMGARKTDIKIIREPGSIKDYNTAWTVYKTYTPKEVKYTIDSMIGYQKPAITQKTFKVFDKYLYQNVEFYSLSKQILGQAGIHNSQAKGYSMNIDPTKVPKNGKLKGYNYSLSSVLGGAKHWEIVDVTVSVGALFLSPAAGFAAHGAMALIGPQPGNEPVQYYISNRKSDIEIVREIYSPHNDARKATNTGKDIVADVAGVFSDDAKDAVKGTKVKSYSEKNLNFNQKGKVTNLFVYSATMPKDKWFIMANPEYTQAKNVKLKGSAIYYAPSFKNLKANEYFYNVKTKKIEKSKIQTIKTVRYGSIK